jgi:hypothetical protein
MPSCVGFGWYDEGAMRLRKGEVRIIRTPGQRPVRGRPSPLTDATLAASRHDTASQASSRTPSVTLGFAGLRRAVGPMPSTAHARPRFKGWRRAPCWIFWLHCHPLERVPPGESQMSANDPSPSRPRPESESTQINDAVGWFLDGCGGSPADRGALRCSVSVRLLQAEHKVPTQDAGRQYTRRGHDGQAQSGSKVVSQSTPSKQEGTSRSSPGGRSATSGHTRTAPRASSLAL